MCESTVYLLRGSEKKLVMAEAAKVISSADGVLCISLAGEQEAVAGAWIAEADLMKHEIVLRSRQG